MQYTYLIKWCINSSKIYFYYHDCYTYPVGLFSCEDGDRRGRNRMVAGFTTNYAISAYHHYR